MPIRFRCHQCGQKLRVGDDKIAMRAKCPRCRQLLVVPATSTEPDDPPATASPAAVSPTDTAAPGNTSPPAVTRETLTITDSLLAPVSPAKSGPVDPAPPQSSVESPPEPSPGATEEAANISLPVKPLPAVPPAPAAGTQPQLPPPPPPPTLPEIIVDDDHVEWIYDTEPETGHAPAVDYRITVSRRVVYTQGILLGVVAVLAFLLGFAVRGSLLGPQADSGMPQPCVVTGQVTYAGMGQDRPDHGSVVILVPVDQRPQTDSKAVVAGLRPGDPEPLPDNASLRMIRSLGGDYVRTNDQGAFRLRVSDRGEYFALVISSHAHRSADEPIEKRDVAQLGRYFVSPLDLLSDRRYRWDIVVIRRDKFLEIQF